MIHTDCGTDVPAEVGAYVTHMAECPAASDALSAWCRQLIADIAALAETPAISPETPDETPAISPETPSETRETSRETPRDSTVPTTARLAELRDSGMSLRDLAVLADIAPETVRRRIARHRAGGDS